VGADCLVHTKTRSELHVVVSSVDTASIMVGGLHGAGLPTLLCNSAGASSSLGAACLPQCCAHWVCSGSPVQHAEANTMMRTLIVLW
jgi:hypothetical protein